MTGSRTRGRRSLCLAASSARLYLSGSGRRVATGDDMWVIWPAGADFVSVTASCRCAGRLVRLRPPEPGPGAGAQLEGGDTDSGSASGDVV